MTHKPIARFALAIALTVLATSSRSMHAQNPTPPPPPPPIITGSDPQPIQNWCRTWRIVLPFLIAAVRT